MSRRFLVSRWVWVLVVLLVAVCFGWHAARRAGYRSPTGPMRAAAIAAPLAGHTPFVVPVTKQQSDVDRQIAKLDPRADSWESEVVSEAIDQQLKQLAHGLLTAGYDQWPTIAAADFHGTVPADGSLATIRQDRLLRVRRLPEEPSGLVTVTSLAALAQTWLSDTAAAARCSSKITDIQVENNVATARIVIELVHHAPHAIIQHNVEGLSRWGLIEGRAPQLSHWRTVRQEEVQLADRQPLFEEITPAVIGPTDAYRDQVLRGLDYWSQRLTGLDDMHIYGHHGVAVGDVDGDGLEDVYVCDSGGLPNRLYLQQPDGTVVDASRESGADWLEATSAALLVDLDNDGDEDLVAATIAAVVFAANNGRGVFRIRNAFPGLPEAHTLCAADYDNDGDLDVYITSYGPGGSRGGARGFEASLPIPYHDANNGGRNVLLKNLGGFRFQDVTGESGLEMNNRRWSFAASWEDFDADGDMDLYVANDFGRNNLYRNEGGKFRDVAAQLGVEDTAAGMSVSWGDSNRDGLMDMYVGNMFSAAGNRVTYQRRFLASQSLDRSQGIQRMARGNTLFVANRDGRFSDVSSAAGVTMGRWAWGSKFVDLSNDGWQDLVVTNGYFTSEKPDDL